MAENSKIEWTDNTFNPWRGCSKISAGCAHCYAADDQHSSDECVYRFGKKATGNTLDGRQHLAFPEGTT